MKQTLVAGDKRRALRRYDALTAACVTCHSTEKLDVVPLSFRPSSGR